jgi:plastocyanin
MTTRFATPLVVAGLLALGACSSSNSTSATTVGSTSAASTTTSKSTGSSTDSGTGNSAAATTASTAASSTVPDSAATVDVKAIEGVAWEKKAYTATAKDGKVTINGSNTSSIAHNLYVVDTAGTVIGDFINLPSKGSKDARVLPLAPGTYHIVCKVPGHNNMNSTLTVS